MYDVENILSGSYLWPSIWLQPRDNEWARSSKLSRRTDARNMKSSLEPNHNIDQSVSPDYEKVSSTCLGNGNGNYHQAEYVPSHQCIASIL